MLASDYNVLPYAGGWAEQPAWWLDDVTHFQLREEYERLIGQLPKAPGRSAPKAKTVSDDDGQ